MRAKGTSWAGLRLKKFEKVRDMRVEKQLNQLHTKSTFDPMNIANTSEKEKENTIKLLMILKEKRVRTVKGRACTDVQK